MKHRKRQATRRQCVTIVNSYRAVREYSWPCRKSMRNLRLFNAECVLPAGPYCNVARACIRDQRRQARAALTTARAAFRKHAQTIQRDAGQPLQPFKKTCANPPNSQIDLCKGLPCSMVCLFLLQTFNRLHRTRHSTGCEARCAKS